MPAAGPMASTGNAQRHPAACAIAGTSWIVAVVSRNPSDVCRASAVPTACGGATSVTRALNCAESAITKNPHSQATARSHTAGASKKAPSPQVASVRLLKRPELALEESPPFQPSDLSEFRLSPPGTSSEARLPGRPSEH